MAQTRKGRSGRTFFIIAVLTVFSAIVGTVLGANDLHNLNRVLAHFGYPSVSASQFSVPWPFAPRPAGPVVQDVRISKGLRLPAPTINMPVYALGNLKAAPMPFVRAIRMDPEKLCDALKANGFPEISWTAGVVDGSGSECSAVISFGKVPTVAHRESAPPPADPLDDTEGQIGPDDPPPPRQSSLFILLKADQKGRVLSFRVKFNIEVEADRAAVIAAGSRAVDSFLKQVHWQDDGDMRRRIEALEEFDQDDFGSHILFKREWGDVPRYNFLARQSQKRRTTLADAYFDPFAWLPLSDAGLSVWMPASGLHSLPL
jgi:hypothetical protein